ncbi:hypothetical protein A4X09_0g1878 [Tilletia walkeri]|uniref:Uncharacterized protein n=1 Tax=Tilletia walkeri TaxID=117179 RepID=A0A8X7NCN7_9BASI|nr:hypothetical protein A4X09_0g1878 [Tilletia walkeri]
MAAMPIRETARNLKGAGRRGWQERTVTAGLKARLPQSARRGRTKVGNSSETAQGPVEGGEDKARRTTDLARGVKAFGSTGTVPAIRSAMLLKAVLRRTRGRNTARATASATTPSRETTNTTILLRAVLQDASHRGRGGGTVTAKSGTSKLITIRTAGTVGDDWEFKTHSPRSGRQDHGLRCFGDG